MELIKKYFSALIAIISSTSVLGGGFYAYGVFENRLAQLESREYVIEQTVDLQPVYEKIDEVRDNLVLRQDGFNEKIDTAKEIMLQRISENSREIGANVAKAADVANQNTTDVKVNRTEIDLLKLKIEEIELANDNPLK